MLPETPFFSSTGVANLSLTVPDTITQWKASGFCMNDKVGFGISPTISLNVFQPFFVELTLPYSVVCGEAFTLKASVFNYLNRSIQVPTPVFLVYCMFFPFKLSSNFSCMNLSFLSFCGHSLCALEIWITITGWLSEYKSFKLYNESYLFFLIVWERRAVGND
jgi:hypothetical protein